MGREGTRERERERVDLLIDAKTSLLEMEGGWILKKGGEDRGCK